MRPSRISVPGPLVLTFLASANRHLRTSERSARQPAIGLIAAGGVVYNRIHRYLGESNA
jgi:hypothetical protein